MASVVRYDHDRDAPGGHDITEDGLSSPSSAPGQPPVTLWGRHDYLSNGLS